MRLINVSTRKLEEFVGDKVPLYAILSHTWGDEEVTFPQFAKWRSRSLKGYEKIKHSCRLTAEHGLIYVWIDTCCIDKSSSAELSEAINSMYHWYHSAEVCFAYISDFQIAPGENPRTWDDNERESALSNLGKSRWFTRGWTLQELLAPAWVEFFDSRWKCFGKKSHLTDRLACITKIENLFFKWPEQASVAQKFSWAANRKTTRAEDIAYCLLGLFDINMPLLYGEGDKAFRRLQLEILRSSDDESIFAWTDKSLWTSGMLATSPSNFADSARVKPIRAGLDYRGPYQVIHQGSELYRSPYQMTHQGLQIEFKSFTGKTGQQSTRRPFETYLRCFEENNAHPEKLVSLLLEPIETLPGATRARRVLPWRFDFDKSSDTQSSQGRGNRPGSAGRGSFLIKDHTVSKSRAFRSSYFRSRGNPDPDEQGKPSLYLRYDIWLTPHDAVGSSDGRDYVVVDYVPSGRSSRFQAMVIRLPHLVCEAAPLELFFFDDTTPLDGGPQRMLPSQEGYDDRLGQIQTGQPEPFLLFEGDQHVGRVAPDLDIFVACKPFSATGLRCFEVEMQMLW